MIEKINFNIGEKIAKFRKLKRWSQQELADRLGLNRSSVTYYEQNNTELNLKQLNQIAQVLEVSVLDLILEPNDDSPTEKIRALNKEELKEKLKFLEIEITFLKKELLDKEKSIADKNKIIDLYEQKMKRLDKQIKDLNDQFNSKG